MKQLSGLSLDTKKQKVVVFVVQCSVVQLQCSCSVACSVFLIFAPINQQLFYLALCTQICVESVKYLTKQNLGNWKRTLACSGLQIYLTIDSGTGVFLSILRNCLEHLFHRTPLDDCFYTFEKEPILVIIEDFLYFISWKKNFWTSFEFHYKRMIIKFLTSFTNNEEMQCLFHFNKSSENNLFNQLSE